MSLSRRQPRKRFDAARSGRASKREVIRHFVDQQTVPPNTDRDHLNSRIYEFTAELIVVYRAVPRIAGAEGALRAMRKSGYLLATTPGFDRAITDSIFTHLGWQKYFVATVRSDNVAEGRIFPYVLFHVMESARVASVAGVVAAGDTWLELQAGSNAGLRCNRRPPRNRDRGETPPRVPRSHSYGASPTFSALVGIIPQSGEL